MRRDPVARPLFLPHRQPSYVAVRPFKWKGRQMGPGDDVPKDWPVWHLRHLHAQSLIGPKGHKWSERRMESWAKRIADGLERRKKRAEQQVAELEARAENADLEAEEAMEVAEEARTLKDRIAGLFGGGESDGRSAGDSHTT